MSIKCVSISKETMSGSRSSSSERERDVVEDVVAQHEPATEDDTTDEAKLPESYARHIAKHMVESKKFFEGLEKVAALEEDQYRTFLDILLLADSVRQKERREELEANDRLRLDA